MASPALDAFLAWVDSTNLNASNKTAAKQRGTALYVAATGEEAAHIVRHLDGAIATASGENLARLQQIKVLCESLATEPAPHTATAVADILLATSEAEEIWMQAFRALFLSRTLAQAGRLFDDLLARHDSPAVRTRLTALKDLIASRGL